MQPSNEDPRNDGSPGSRMFSQRKDEEHPRPRAPDRMGTWQFMSVNSLNQPTNPIAIADELESFFHVLLYCAIRFLPHTCPDAPYFVQKYFDAGVGFDDDSGRYTCGLLKRGTLKMGELCTSYHSPICFLRKPLLSPTVREAEISEADRHPIDGVLRQLLELFAALYKHRRESRNTPHGSSCGTGSTIGTEVRESAAFALLRVAFQPKEPSAESIKTDADREACRKDSLADTAELLTSHDEVARILWRALYSDKARWPEEDKQEDQLDPKYWRGREEDFEDEV